MAFDSFQAFLHMGKHGFYVWLSYGFFIVCLSLLVLSLLRENRKLKKACLDEGL